MSRESWKDDDLEADIENLKRYFIGERAAEYKHMNPEMRLELIKSGTLSRIVYHFKKGSFAVLPGYSMNQGRRKNFEHEYRLTRRIRQNGYCYVPVITFWEYIGDRALFIQKLRGEGDAEELAVEFNLEYFLVGSEGHWGVYRTYDSEVMDCGLDLRIVDVDVDFYRYCQIQKKKAWLREQLKNIQEKHEKLDSHQEKTVAGLRRRLEDLEKVEEELLC
ncbi:MAG: hypothetical protein JSV53_03385 [candidate division WOR-3 bacterium]|nr:MAG: hypothetical protein JSV53_03385 [candidate division WOR-3 bacterium]